PFVDTPADGFGSCLDRRAVGDAVQPTPQRFALPNRACPVEQHEPGRLEGVFGVRGLVQEPTTNAKDHRRVPAQEGREGRFVLPPDKALQKLAVREALRTPCDNGPANVLKDRTQLPTRHRPPCPLMMDVLLYSSKRGPSAPLFLRTLRFCAHIPVPRRGVRVTATAATTCGVMDKASMHKPAA